MDNKKQARDTLADPIKAIPPTPPLTEENATTSYAVQALAKAKNGDLVAIVDLANGYGGCTADTEKAVVLFEEAAFSNDPHWLADAVLNLALQDRTTDTMILQMKIVDICPFFHIKLFYRLFYDSVKILKINNQIAKEVLKDLKKIQNSRRRGGFNASLHYDKTKERCIQMATEVWKSNPVRINYLCEIIHNTLKREIDPCPTPDTIKHYLKTAEKEGLLSIPPEARKGGRPRKDED